MNTQETTTKYSLEQYRHWLHETIADFSTHELHTIIVELSRKMTAEQIEAALNEVWVDGPHIDYENEV